MPNTPKTFKLPQELIDEIVSYLPLHDLVENRKVDSEVVKRAIDLLIWKKWLRKDFESIDEKIPNPIKELEKADAAIKKILSEHEGNYREIIKQASNNSAIAVAAVFFPGCEDFLYQEEIDLESFDPLDPLEEMELEWSQEISDSDDEISFSTEDDDFYDLSVLEQLRESKKFRKDLSKIHPLLTEKEIFTQMAYNELNKENPDLEFVRTLIEEGGEINLRPLNKALLQEEQLERIKTLIELGATGFNEKVSSELKEKSINWEAVSTLIKGSNENKMQFDDSVIDKLTEMYSVKILNELEKKDINWEIVSTLIEETQKNKLQLHDSVRGKLTKMFYENIQHANINVGATNRLIRLGAMPSDEKIIAACFRNSDKSNFANFKTLIKFLIAKKINAEKTHAKLTELASQCMEQSGVDTARTFQDDTETEKNKSQLKEILSRYLEEMLFGTGKLLEKNGYTKENLEKYSFSDLVDICFQELKEFSKTFDIKLESEELEQIYPKYLHCLFVDKNTTLQKLGDIPKNKLNKVFGCVVANLGFFKATPNQNQELNQSSATFSLSRR